MNESALAVDDDVPGTSTPDVSGVPSAQLKALVEEHLDVDVATLAGRIGMDPKYLKRLVIDPVVPVIKLGMADKILLALDLNLATLERDGLITIVPLRKTRSAAMRIVDEEIAVAEDCGLPVPTEAEVEARINDLLITFDQHCIVTEKMRERRERDSERKKND